MKKEVTMIIKKKIHQRLVSLAIALSMLISIFSITVYASEPEPPFLNTYAANYFHTLDENFGNNIESTCGYVAAGMLLSFYDSYWNDGFISENYDVVGAVDSISYNVTSSPGINRESDWTDDSNYTNYNSFINTNAGEHFHLRLLQIGRDELNLCDPTLKEWIENVFFQKPIETDWLINLYDIENLIEEYISNLPEENEIIKNNVTVNVSFFHNINYYLNDNWNLTIRANMIEKIKAGIPVIYFGYSQTENAGHFMIGYDYDEATDTIYFHTGWGNDSTMTDKESNAFIYNSNTGILWLEINDSNLLHQHSYNYTDSENNSYCSCQLYKCHPSHNQNHMACKTDVAINGHLTKCHCEAVINVVPHSYSGLFVYSNTHHCKVCSTCGYSLYGTHSFDIGESISNSEHNMICECGYNGGTEEHYAFRYEKKNNTSHYKYCECGYLIGTQTHDMYQSGLYNICRDCGCMVNKLTDITIKGVEDEIETETE